mgnify:CR=1 FL=1
MGVVPAPAWVSVVLACAAVGAPMLLVCSNVSPDAVGGIDRAAQDSAFFEKFMAEQGPVWIDLVKGLNMEPQ